MQEPRDRSPLAEKLTDDPDRFLRSPLGYSPNSFMSTRVLPPARFHTGLLTPHSLVDENDDNEESVDDSESVAFVPDDMDCGYSEEEEDDPLQRPIGHNLIGELPRTSLKSAAGTLNRGFGMENLTVEVPTELRRFTTGGDVATKKCSSNKLTPGPASAHVVQERVLLHNMGVRIRMILISSHIDLQIQNFSSSMFRNQRKRDIHVLTCLK